MPGEINGGKGSSYNKVLVSPDDKMFVATQGKEIHFWSLKSGKIIELYTNSHGGKQQQTKIY